MCYAVSWMNCVECSSSSNDGGQNSQHHACAGRSVLLYQVLNVGQQETMTAIPTSTGWQAKQSWDSHGNGALLHVQARSPTKPQGAEITQTAETDTV